MGLAADRRMWMLQLPVLTPHFRCITFDNRGIGESVAPPGPFSMEQMAADALAVLYEAGIERAHVLGSSVGRAIPLHLAPAPPQPIPSLCWPPMSVSQDPDP